MTAALRFDPIRLPPVCEELRREVRAFLAEEIAAGTFDPHKPQREDNDAPEFSRRVGARGWIGMTWPKEYGGGGLSWAEAFALDEELWHRGVPRVYDLSRLLGAALMIAGSDDGTTTL